MRLVRIGLWTLAGAAVLVAAAVVFRAPIAERLAPLVARDLGVPLQALSVVEMGPGRLVVGDVVLGDGDALRIGKASLTYDLFEGTVRLATVEGVRLRMDPFGGGPPVPGLSGAEDAVEPSYGPPGALPPLPPIRFDDVVVTVATPLGPVSARLDGTARLGPDGVDVATALIVDGAGAAGRGRIAVVGPSLETLTATLTLDEAAAEAEGARLSGLAGEATVAIAGGKPARLEARFSAAEVADEGMSPGGARISVEASPESLALDVDIGKAEAGLAVAAKLRLADVATSPRVTLSASATARADHPLVAALAAARKITGQATVALRGDGEGPPLESLPSSLGEVVDWLAASRFRGDADVGLAGVGLGVRVSGLDAKLPLRLSAEPGTITVALRGDASAVARRLAPFGGTPPAALRPALARVAPGGRLSLAARGESGFRVHLSERRATMRLSARLTGDRNTSVALSGALAADLDDTGRPTKLRAAPLSLTAENLPLPTADCRSVAVSLSAAAELSPEAVTAALSGPGAVSARDCRMEGGIRTETPVKLAVSRGRVRLDRAGAVAYAVSAEAGPVTLGEDGAPAERVAARLGSVSADGGLDPAGAHAGTLTVAGLRVESLTHGLVVDDGSATLKLGGSAAALDGRFRFGVAHRPDGSPAFAPLTVAGTVRQAGGRIRLDAAIGGAGGRLDARLRADHRVAAGAGSARLTVAPIVLVPGDGLPKSLSPRLAKVEDASGTIRLGGEARWSKSGLDGTASVGIDDLSFRAPQGEVSGLSGDIVLDHLHPPATAGVRTLTARRIVAGVPFEDVRLALALPADAPGKLRITGAEARFAGGRFSLPDTLIDLAAPRHDFRLDIAGLDLGILSALADVKGIKATGRMSGSLPVTVEGGTFAVADGTLATTGPGTLAIKSEAAKAALQGGGQPVALILQAVEDFRYTALGLGIDKPPTGKSRIHVRLEGNNPAVLDGHPFAFNINLQGDMDKVLQVLRRGTDLSSEILRRRRNRP